MNIRLKIENLRAAAGNGRRVSYFAARKFFTVNRKLAAAISAARE